jgi:hypothetical protein
MKKGTAVAEQKTLAAAVCQYAGLLYVVRDRS